MVKNQTTAVLTTNTTLATCVKSANTYKSIPTNTHQKHLNKKKSTSEKNSIRRSRIIKIYLVKHKKESTDSKLAKT